MTDIEIATIRQGNTGTLYKLGVQGNPSLAAGGPDYTCEISVPDAVPPISRFTTDLLDSDTRFAVQLTPAETTTLVPGRQYSMSVEIENLTLTPVFRVETLIRFYVADQAIP